MRFQRLSEDGFAFFPSIIRWNEEFGRRPCGKKVTGDTVFLNGCEQIRREILDERVIGANHQVICGHGISLFSKILFVI